MGHSLTDDTMDRPAPQEARATAAMLGGALGFSLMGMCVKALGSRLPVAEVVLARAVVSLALSWWLLRRAGVDPWGRRRGQLFVRGLVGSLGLFCVFAALMRLPLAVATVIQYLNPLFTALLAWPLLGERFGWGLLPALLTGWLGVVLIAGPAGGGAAGLPLGGVLIALVGALLSALAYVQVRELGRSEHPLVIVFWFPLVSVPLSLPLVLLDPVAPTPVELLWLLAVGLFTQLGQLGLTRGLTGLPAARATTIGYAQVPFAALGGWWLFGEPFDARRMLGALLVLVAAVLAGRGEAPRRKGPGASP
jgi:drug/metabolite transporter (DMT)-like permease